MGYELYRLLATRTQRKKRKAKKVVSGPVCIDIEEEDKEKYMLDGKKEMGQGNIFTAERTLLHVQLLIKSIITNAQMSLDDENVYCCLFTNEYNQGCSKTDDVFLYVMMRYASVESFH